MWKSARASKRARQAGSGWVRDGARHTSMLRGIEPAPLHVEELSLASSAPRRDGLDVEQPSRRISSEVLEAHLLLLLLDRLRHRFCSAIARQLHLFRCQRGGASAAGGGASLSAALFFRAAFQAAVFARCLTFMRSACTLLASSHAASAAA